MKRAWLLAILGACAAPKPPALLPPGTVGGIVATRDGPLPEAFVYVKSGLEGRRFEVPKEPVLLDQHGNEFTPHVFGLRAGQPLRIRSSDSGLHNVYCVPFNNAEFNVSMMHEESVTKVFAKPEVMIPFKCNIHGNMRAYAGVLDHPYFTVTGADGRFQIRGLPPGDYTIEAWSEYHGSRQTKLTVGSEPLAPIRFSWP